MYVALWLDHTCKLLKVQISRGSCIAILEPVQETCICVVDSIPLHESQNLSVQLTSFKNSNRLGVESLTTFAFEQEP